MAQALAQSEPPDTVSNDMVKAKAKSMRWRRAAAHGQRAGARPASTPRRTIGCSCAAATTPLIDLKAHRRKLTGLVDKSSSSPVYDLRRTSRPYRCATDRMRGLGSTRQSSRARAASVARDGAARAPALGRRAPRRPAEGGGSQARRRAYRRPRRRSRPSCRPPRVIRSIPMAQAMNEKHARRVGHEQRGAAVVHGCPLRLVVPGWVGSASTKWLPSPCSPLQRTYMTSSYVMPRSSRPGEKMPP